jgi:hypothetical protein
MRDVKMERGVDLKNYDKVLWSYDLLNYNYN